MKPIRNVMASMPELSAFHERLNDPDFPSAAEVAQAMHNLAHPPMPKQPQFQLSVCHHQGVAPEGQPEPSGFGSTDSD